MTGLIGLIFVYLFGGLVCYMLLDTGHWILGFIFAIAVLGVKVVVTE